MSLRQASSNLKKTWEPVTFISKHAWDFN